MNTPNIAGARIGRDLRDVEASLDSLLCDHAKLTATLAKARLDLGETVGNTQVVFLRMSKAQDAILQARAELARTHGELERIARERGDIMFDPKPEGKLTDDTSDLQIAA